MHEFERASFHQESVDEEKNQGKFLFEPLERGFGITVGNAICRTLLSNLAGMAVVGVQAEGLDPNSPVFNAIEEDVVRLSLNAKGLRLSGETDQLETLKIEKAGPAVITAADIICPEHIDVADPDQVICHLKEGQSLNMKLFAASGTGYKSAADVKAEYELPEDTVVLDATFTPIRNAEYLSEPARLGQDIKYDKVHIDVTTNGTLTPLSAISQAAKILVQALDVIVPLADLNLEESFTVQQPLPEASDPSELSPEPGAFLVVIEFDMLAYKKRTSSRAVKKTLSIPEWLNETAMAMDLNFSQVLQEALISKIQAKL